MENSIIWQEANDFLQVRVYADASTEIVSQINGQTWHMGPVALQEESDPDIGHVWIRKERTVCEQYAGRFIGERHGEHIQFTLLNQEQQPVGQFICAYHLVDEWFEVSITHIDDSIPCLTFPTAITSESVVIPSLVGRWIRTPLTARMLWLYYAHLNMRWFGGLEGDHGWIAVAHEGFTDSGVMGTGLNLAPVWLPSLGTWKTRRTIRYRLTTGGYVGLAKAYRQYAIDHGLHRSLREKVEAFPALNNLVGGRLLSLWQAQSFHPKRYEDRLEPVPPDLPATNPKVFLTHDDAAYVIEQARQLGMKSAIAILRGWIRGGYDETHPDIFPPEPALGSEESLRALLAMKDPIMVGLHDNYQDIYRQSPSFPAGVIQRKTGQLMRGGIWAGGQAYILNARHGMAYAQRNWPTLQNYGARCYFPDTITAVQLYEDHAPDHLQTRQQDYETKCELLRFYKAQNQVLGGEEGSDFCIPYVDWLENRHHRIPWVTIPLWNLVFHDAVINVRYTGEMLSHAPQSREWLSDLLWGYPMLWFIRDRDQIQRERALFEATRAVDEWHQRIAFDDMVDHRYVDESGNIEETVFSSGVAMRVDFASQTYQILE